MTIKDSLHMSIAIVNFFWGGHVKIDNKFPFLGKCGWCAKFCFRDPTLQMAHPYSKRRHLTYWY